MELAQWIQSAYGTSPRVKAVLDEAGVGPGSVNTVKDLEMLPVTSKEALVSLQADNPPFGGLLGVKKEELARVFASPGPIYDPEGKQPDFWRWAAAAKAARFETGECVINTFSYHLTPAGFMFDSGLRALGCTVLPGGIGNKELQVDLIKHFGITGYVGLPSYLMALLEQARTKGMEAGDFPINKALVTAEPLPPSLRAELDGKGIEVYQSYGTADLGCVSFECERHEGMHISDGLIFEIVEPGTGQQLAPGEPGEIVVTLLNQTYPLLRFGTGDLGVLTDEPCGCGREGVRLKGILGRVGDAVKVRGLFVHPSQLKQLMQELPEVDYYQAVISREQHIDIFTVRVETKASVVGSNLASKLSERIRERLRIKVDVDLVSPGRIDREQPQFHDLRQWD